MKTIELENTLKIFFKNYNFKKNKFNGNERILIYNKKNAYSIELIDNEICLFFSDKFYYYLSFSKKKDFLNYCKSNLILK